MEQAIVKTKRSCKILAFGDSLTEGFFAEGFKFHPYSIALKNLIETKLKNENKECIVEIREEGKSGEFTEDMTYRLRDILYKNAENKPFDIICILGGTNDLSEFGSIASTEIFENLKVLYDAALQSNPNVQVVAMSIPQSGVKMVKYIDLRTEVNRLIGDYTKSYNETIKSNSENLKRNPIIFIDLEHLFPYYIRNTDIVDSTHWDDTLHMTPAGYDLFGKIVFEHIEDAI